MPSGSIGIVQRAKNQLFGSTAHTAAGVQAVEVADARAGIVYFLAKTDARALPPSFGSLVNAAVGSFVGNVGEMKDLAVGIIDATGPGHAAMNKVGQAATAVKDWTADKIKPVTDMLKNFFEWLKGRLKAIYGYALDGVTWFADVAMYLTSAFVETLKSAIPGWGYASDAAGILSGVTKAVMNTKRWFDGYQAGKGVDVLGGHPHLIIKALSRHMAANVVGGLTTAGSGALTLAIRAGADGLGGGTGVLVGIISTILQKVAGLVDMMIQRFFLDKCLSQAREEWKLHPASPLINDNKTFSEWFQKVMMLTPVVAALAMSSGFAAHPLKFLQLCDADGSANAGSWKRVGWQVAYNQGLSYITELKRQSDRYLTEYCSGYNLEFTSHDPFVRGLLRNALKGRSLPDVEPRWVRNPHYEPPGTWNYSAIYKA